MRDTAMFWFQKYSELKELAAKTLATASVAVNRIAYRQCDEHGLKWKRSCLGCTEAKEHNQALEKAVKALDGDFLIVKWGQQ